MGTTGEYLADGVEKCECGCTDLIVKKETKMTIKRNNDCNVTNEYDDNSEDFTIMCEKCKEVLG